MSEKILVIGLGNPGKEYERTRHNVGFHIIDALCDKLSINLSFQKSCKSFVGISTLNENKIIIAKPQTFMNLSGVAVIDLLRWYEVSPNFCIVVTDNVDLSVGTLRVKSFGTGGQHNGIRSIQQHLSSYPQGLYYIRLYLGIGSQRTNLKLASYVLAKWHSSEEENYQNMFNLARDSIINAIQDYHSDLKLSFYELLSRKLSQLK